MDSSRIIIKIKEYMFYKHTGGQWLQAKEIHFPDGIILSSENKVEKDGWKWMENSPIQYQAINLQNASLMADIDFGNHLIKAFLIDNRESPISFTPEQSGALLQKFGVVKALAEVGDVRNMQTMLSLIEVDDIFTQERKDKYIAMCNAHINQ